MKKFTLFICVLLINFISTNAYAETIKDYYENTKCLKSKYKVKNGLKNGKYIEYFPNKKIKIVTFYKNDQLDGDFIIYHENGNIRSKSSYINNIKTGLCHGYDEDGHLLYINSYENDKKNGFSTIYGTNGKVQITYVDDIKTHAIKYDIYNKKEYEEFYDAGLLKKFISYDDDNFIKEEIIYENQQITKTSTFYTPETQDFQNIMQTIIKDINPKFGNYISLNASYINKNITFNHENGNVYSIIKIFDTNNSEIFILKSLEQNDKTISLNFTFYCEDEKLTENFDYNKNLVLVERYYLNGTFASAIKKDLKNRILDGTYKFYNANGNIEFVQTWKNNKLIELDATTYYPNGNIYIKSHSTNDKLNGKFIEYYPNKQIKISKTYLNGNLNGKVTTYHQNGQIEGIGYYKNGKANGLFKYYYPNGVLSDELNYVNDKLSGTAKLYWENGIIAYIDTYINGEKTSRKAFNRYGKQLWYQKY